jgi:hypothetical protein
MLKLIVVMNLCDSKAAQLFVSVGKAALLALLLAHPLAWIMGWASISTFDIIFLVSLAFDFFIWTRFWKKKAWVEQELRMLEAGA